MARAPVTTPAKCALYILTNLKVAAVCTRIEVFFLCWHAGIRICVSPEYAHIEGNHTHNLHSFCTSAQDHRFKFNGSPKPPLKPFIPQPPNARLPLRPYFCILLWSDLLSRRSLIFSPGSKNFANLSGATLATPPSCVTLLWFSTSKICKDRKPNETDIFTELPTFSYSLRYSTYSRNLKRLRDVFGEGIHSFQFS